MKYMLVYYAIALFDNPEFKEQHPDAWMFFTNDPSSVGFKTVVNLMLLFLVMISLLASVGSQIQNAMPYFRVVLVVLQILTVLS
jgi:hypothetical protein